MRLQFPSKTHCKPSEDFVEVRSSNRFSPRLDHTVLCRVERLFVRFNLKKKKKEKTRERNKDMYKIINERERSFAVSIIRTLASPSPPPPPPPSVVYYARDGYSETDETASPRYITEEEQKRVRVNRGNWSRKWTTSSDLFLLLVLFLSPLTRKKVLRERAESGGRIDIKNYTAFQIAAFRHSKLFFSNSRFRDTHVFVATDRSKTKKVRGRVERVLESSR